jgi:hypothetical protein
MLLIGSHMLYLQFAIFYTVSDKMVAHINVFASLMKHKVLAQGDG